MSACFNHVEYDANCPQCQKQAAVVRNGTTMLAIPREKIEADPQPAPRNPQLISGDIRRAAELFVRRFNAATMGADMLVDDLDDAQRILALLTELDSALITNQYEASLKGARR